MIKKLNGIAMVAAMVLLMGGAALAEARVRVGVSIGRPVVHHRFHYVPARHRVYAVPAYSRVVRVERVNYGSVDFNVEPQKSQIFVDGQYLGIADDFNGYPQTAKLPAGYHWVRAVAPDGRTIERRIYVAAGQELNFNWDF